MANEIQWRGTETGVTLYATIRSKTGTQWNTAGTPNFEAVTAANWADYDVALAESSGNYFYVGTFPAITGNMVAGWYWVDVYKKAGATVAITDVLQGTVVGYWDGTSLLPWESDVRAIAANAITAAAINADAITADKIADNAIAAEHLADNAINLATFAADVKTGSALKANVETITAGIIANASFNADVGSTAYATNIIALAVRKVLDELNLDHLMKVAVASNTDLTTEVVDATVLSYIMSAGDTSVFAPATDGLQPIRDENVAEHDVTQAAIAGIGSGTGSSLNFAVADDNANGAMTGTPYDEATVSFTGTATNTFADTSAAGGNALQIADDGNVIRYVAKFTVGASRNASVVDILGRVTNGDSVTVKAFNGSTWDLRKTIVGVTSTTYALHEVKLLAEHTGTGSYAGHVYLLFECATDSVLYIDEMLCTAISVGSTTGYADGAVWVKAVANGGIAGTTPDVNGTADRPCPWADALVVAAAKGLTRFRIANGETVTLDADTKNKSLIGKNWILELGSQDISDSYFEGAKVSGIASAAVATPPIFEYCGIGEVTMPGCRMYQCGLGRASGKFTAVASSTSAQYNFIDCFSLVPGANVPEFTFIGGTTTRGIQFRRWSGGTNLTLDAVCVLSLEVVTGGGQTIAVGGANVEIRGITRSIALTTIASTSTVQINCVTGPITLAGSDGTVNVYGVCSSVTDSRTGGTLANHADVHVNTETILADTNELQTNQGNWATATGFATPTNVTDAVTALATAHGDGSWATATGFSTHSAADVVTELGTGSTLTALATAANLATLDTLVDRLAPLLIGNVTGAGTGTEVYAYGGVTATVTVDEDGNVSGVVFS